MAPRRSQFPLAATSARLADGLPSSVMRHGRAFSVRLLKSSELTNEERDSMWAIIEHNMSTMSSQSSMGWDAEDKQKETFHSDSRFIILSVATSESDTGRSEQQGAQVIGFSVFRFDYEEGEKLLYCYEVQLCESSRRLGLGRFLMHEIIRIGRAWNMEKVMLTVLKVNTDAARFYREIGFTLDPSSPDYIGESEDDELGDAEPECDYEILSVTL